MASRISPSTPPRTADAGERRWKRLPRPTSSSESAKRRSARHARGPDQLARASGTGVVGQSRHLALLRAGRDQPDVARRVESAQALARGATSDADARGVVDRVRAPAGTLSVWAMRMTRQLPGRSSLPITLRDCPRPGTRKGSTSTSSPAARNWRATYWCARRSFLTGRRDGSRSSGRGARRPGTGSVHLRLTGEAPRSAVRASAAIEVASTRDV